MSKSVKIAYFDTDTPKDTVLNANGISLDRYVTKCVPKEELEIGNYTLDVTLINTDGLFSILKEEVILKAKVNYGYEIFRISKVSKDIKYIDIVARQITIADSINMWLKDVRPTNLSGADAGKHLIDNSIADKKEISIHSDIPALKTAYYVRQNLHQALTESDNAFLKVWGGEIRRRQYDIFINTKIGDDNAFIVRDKKNLIGFEVDSDIDDLITRAVGEGYNGVLGNYIDSPKITNYNRVYTKVFKYDDVKVKDSNNTEGFNTEAEAKTELDRRVRNEFLNNKVDEIKVSYRLEFVDLIKVRIPDNIIFSNTLNVGDAIRVYISKHDIDTVVRVTSTEYDVLAEKFINIVAAN